MSNLPGNQQRDDLDRPARSGHAPREPYGIRPVEIDGQQRQNAVLAERDPDSVASVLAAFRRRRGFERSSLAAWLRLSPDGLVALTLARRPDPASSDYEEAVAGLARRYGANPVRLAEALAE